MEKSYHHCPTRTRATPASSRSQPASSAKSVCRGSRPRHSSRTYFAKMRTLRESPSTSRTAIVRLELVRTGAFTLPTNQLGHFACSRQPAAAFLVNVRRENDDFASILCMVLVSAVVFFCTSARVPARVASHSRARRGMTRARIRNAHARRSPTNPTANDES